MKNRKKVITMILSVAVLIILVLAASSSFSTLFEGNLSGLAVKRTPNALEANKKPKNVVVDENGKVQNGSGGSLGQYADNTVPADHSCEKGFMENGQKIWSYCEGIDFVKTITYVNGSTGINSLKPLSGHPDSFIKKIQEIGVDYVEPDRPENHTFQGKYTTVSEVVGYVGLSLSNDTNPRLLFSMYPYMQSTGCGDQNTSQTDGYNVPCFVEDGVVSTPVAELNKMEKLNIVLKNNEVVRLENFVHNFKEIEKTPLPANIQPGAGHSPDTIGSSN